MNFKKIGLAVAISAAAASASANFDRASGELVLNVWNTATSQSFTQGLGINVGASPIDATPFSLSLDSEGLAYIAGNSSDIQWNIAGNIDDISPLNDLFYITSVADTSGFNGSFGFNDLNQAPTPFATLDNGLSANGTATTSGEATLLSGLNYAGGAVWGASAGGLTNRTWIGGNSTATDADGEMHAYFYDQDVDTANNNALLATVDKSVGVWSLDLAGGTINYSAAAPIPVPAAVWMFASGLLGLAGVARRNKKA